MVTTPAKTHRFGSEPPSDEIHRRNMSTMLHHLHLNGPASRAVLAETMKLNRSTIMTLTAELAAAGIVGEHAPADSDRTGRGRPSLIVTPRTEHVYVIAIEIQPGCVSAAKVALGGKIQAYRRIAVPAPVHQQAVISQLLRALRRSARPGLDGICLGIGLTAAHPIVIDYDETRQILRSAARRAGLDPQLPIVAGRNGPLAALAEHRRGAGIGSRTMIYLHRHDTTDGGVIFNGSPLDPRAAHLGHIVVNTQDGLPCYCGARGCLTAEIAPRTAMPEASPLTARTDTRQFARTPAHGNHHAARDLDILVDRLVVGIVNLHRIFSPDIVVLAGTLRYVLNQYPGRLGQAITQAAPEAQRVDFRPAALAHEPALIGAAEMAFTEAFNDPAFTSQVGRRQK